MIDLENDKQLIVDMANKNYDEWLPSVLRNNVMEVTFTKADGTERVMKCTLKSDSIKPVEKKTDRTRAKNNEALAVWDLEKETWRSFRYDSITCVSYYGEQN